MKGLGIGKKRRQHKLLICSLAIQLIQREEAFPVNGCKHIHTHALAHTYTHIDTQTHTYTYARAHTHTHARERLKWSSINFNSGEKQLSRFKDVRKIIFFF